MLLALTTNHWKKWFPVLSVANFTKNFLNNKNHIIHKESLEQQKPHKAFETKALHDKSISEVSKCKEMKSRVENKYKDAQHRCDAIIARVDWLKEELKIVEEEKVKCEGEMAITLAEKVHIG